MLRARLPKRGEKARRVRCRLPPQGNRRHRQSRSHTGIGIVIGNGRAIGIGYVSNLVMMNRPNPWDRAAPMPRYLEPHSIIRRRSLGESIV